MNQGSMLGMCLSLQEMKMHLPRDMKRDYIYVQFSMTKTRLIFSMTDGVTDSEFAACANS